MNNERILIIFLFASEKSVLKSRPEKDREKDYIIGSTNASSYLNYKGSIRFSSMINHFIRDILF